MLFESFTVNLNLLSMLIYANSLQPLITNILCMTAHATWSWSMYQYNIISSNESRYYLGF